MAPIPMVPKLWGPPGLTQRTDTAQGSSVRVRVADDNKRTSVSYKKKATWGYGSARSGDADEECSLIISNFWAKTLTQEGCWSLFLAHLTNFF